MEAYGQRIGDSHEVTLAVGLHLVFLAADINDDLAGFGSCNAEIGTAFLVNFRKFIARNGGLSDESIGGHLYLLRHFNVRTLRLIA